MKAAPLLGRQQDVRCSCFDHSTWHRRVHLAKDTDGGATARRAEWTAGSRGCGAELVAAVSPITLSQGQRQKPWYMTVSTHQEPDRLFLKTVYYSSLLLENTHAMAHRPRSQTEEKGREKAGEKRQQYIKCFSFNQTNLKDVQSGSRCAVHKHGKNKQTEGQSSNTRS